MRGTQGTQEARKSYRIRHDRASLPLSKALLALKSSVTVFRS